MFLPCLVGGSLINSCRAFFAEDAQMMAKDIASYLFERLGVLCTKPLRKTCVELDDEELLAKFSTLVTKDDDFRLLTHRLGPKVVRLVISAFKEFKNFVREGQEIGEIQGSSVMKKSTIPGRLAAIADSSDYREYFNERKASLRVVLNSLRSPNPPKAIKPATRRSTGGGGGRKKKIDENVEISPTHNFPVTPNQAILDFDQDGKWALARASKEKKAGKRRSTDGEKQSSKKARMEAITTSILDEILLEDNDDDHASSISTTEIDDLDKEAETLEKTLRIAKLKRQIAEEERASKVVVMKDKRDSFVAAELNRVGASSIFLQRKTDALVILDSDDEEADEELRAQGYKIAPRAEVKIEGAPINPNDYEPVPVKIPAEMKVKVESEDPAANKDEGPQISSPPDNCDVGMGDVPVNDKEEGVGVSGTGNAGGESTQLSPPPDNRNVGMGDVPADDKEEGVGVSGIGNIVGGSPQVSPPPDNRNVGMGDVPADDKEEGVGVSGIGNIVGGSPQVSPPPDNRNVGMGDVPADNKSEAGGQVNFEGSGVINSGEGNGSAEGKAVVVEIIPEIP
jgi:hypothetical protein